MLSQGVSQSFMLISKCFKEKGREGRAGRMMGGEKMGMGQKDRDSVGKSFTFGIIGVQSYLVKTHN